MNNSTTTKPCFIIAEAGVNHNGSLEQAFKLIEAAAQSGADAVKFQTFKAESLVTKEAERASYQQKNMGGSETQFEMLKKLELSHDDFRQLKAHCERQKILFLSTPFDDESATFLARELDVALIKTSSGDATNLPFLEFVASFKKPLIVSTGMCDLQDVERAVAAVRAGNPVGELTLLHCTSNYPCEYSEVNLRAMKTLREQFQVPVGYSDHTLGIEIPIAAAAMGATVIEKHFTLDRELPGPDHRCSLLPSELTALVTSIRHVTQALGDGIKRPQAAEFAIKQLVTKSLVAVSDLPAGTAIKREHLTIKRPGTGIAPHEIANLSGRKLKRDKRQDEPFSWDDF